MATMARPVRAAPPAAAVGTAVVSLGILPILAAFAASDSSIPGTAPTPIVWTATAAILVLQSAALLAPRRHSGIILLLAAGLTLLLALVAPSIVFSVSALPVMVAAFLAGLHLPFRTLQGWAVGAAVLVAAGQFVSTLSEGSAGAGVMVAGSLVQGAIVVGLPLLPASILAAQRAARAAQRETVLALSRERDAQIGEAIALERAAMARELHDIAAHHLSGISLMAAAVSRQVASDPEAARTGALQIRQQSNAILDDLRQLVGMLRDAGEAGRDQPAGTLAALPELIGSVRSGGADVGLELREGQAGELGWGIGPLGQLAAFRMVQESLTNARRHAPGARCDVLVDDTDPQHLQLRVRNAPSASAAPSDARGGGFGVLGMRERATMIGGTLDAGPADDGGWAVTMRIPREARPHEPRTTREQAR